MTSALLQDWIDLEGSGNGDVIQSASHWLDMRGFQDALFYLDVRALTTVGTEIRMQYQTAPTVDELLFTNMVADFPMTVTTSPVLTKVLLSRNPTVPPAAFVRWRISVVAGGAWKVVFRIHCVAKKRGA